MEIKAEKSGHKGEMMVLTEGEDDDDDDGDELLA